MIRKAASNVRLSTRVAELCHSAHGLGTATTTRRLTSTVITPIPVPRAEISAAADRGGRFSVEAEPASSPIPTMTTGSKKIGVRPASSAASAAANGAGSAWSTARVIGVSEADASGVNGGGGPSKRCYWALDDAEQARSGRFIAEPGPPQTMEVPLRRAKRRRCQDKSKVEGRVLLLFFYWCWWLLRFVEVVVDGRTDGRTGGSFMTR